jgi:hypothetical protein
MDDVPVEERQAIARKVADKVVGNANGKDSVLNREAIKPG